MSKSQHLTQVLSYLITSQPFIAVLLMELMEIVETDDPKIPTAATNDKHIFLNNKWFGKLTVQEGVFVIAHEVLHVVYQHLPRGKVYADRGIGPDFRKWSHNRANKAADYIINGTLSASGIGKMPLEGLHNPNIGVDDNMDDVYCDLPYEEDKPNQGPAGFDQHLDPVATHSQGQIQRAVAAAGSAAKAQGKLPGTLGRLVGEIIEPQQDWREVLREFMVATLGHEESTWRRLNKKRLVLPPHMPFPGTQGHKAGNIAIVIDVSGSISDNELKAFMSEVDGIMGHTVPEQCKVFWTDTQVSGIDDIDEYTLLAELEPKGGGGTNMEAAFPVIDEQFDGVVDCCVVLTDMYTDFTKPPMFPVLWCATSDVEAPYGRTVHIKA